MIVCFFIFVIIWQLTKFHMVVEVRASDNILGHSLFSMHVLSIVTHQLMSWKGIFLEPAWPGKIRNMTPKLQHSCNRDPLIEVDKNKHIYLTSKQTHFFGCVLKVISDAKCRLNDLHSKYHLNVVTISFTTFIISYNQF